MKPILFNTEMVRALLDGRKSVTRRTVKYTANAVYGAACVNAHWNERYTPENPPESLIEWYVKYIAKPPYHPGDILYVRETWCERMGDISKRGKYIYKAQAQEQDELHKWVLELNKWRPSIHMPKEAARLFLRVTDVRVERLQDSFFRPGTTALACYREGIDLDDQCRECIETYGRPCCIDENDGDEESECECGVLDDVRGEFSNLWDSTIQKKDLPLYGWASNPWVWVIEFERISEEEARE